MHKMKEESKIEEEERKKGSKPNAKQGDQKEKNERMRTGEEKKHRDDRKDTPLVNVIHHYPLS